jgi:hypothetical protein
MFSIILDLLPARRGQIGFLRLRQEILDISSSCPYILEEADLRKRRRLMKRLLFCLGLLGSVALALGQYEPVILFEAVGDTVNQQLGLHTLVPVGDLDGDGYDDILANAHLDGSSFGYSREWRIYYGSPNGTDRHISLARADSLTRCWVMDYKGFFDDIDGNGHLDIWATFLRETVGYARVFYRGFPEFDTIPDWMSPWQSYGGGDIVGDYDADGYTDYVTYQANWGRFWFHRGGHQPESLPSWDFQRSAYDYGVYNGGFGDVNGDGHSDFLRYSTAAAWPDSNAVDLFLGGPNADSLPDVTMKWSSGVGGFWRIVPDLNGDGYDDIAAPWGCPGMTWCIYFGGRSPDFVGDLALFPGSSQPAYSWQSGIGDINGDGYNDLALSGEDSGPGQYGEIAIYLGGRWMDGEPDIVLLGVPGGPYLHAGYRVVSAGDFNGDGISDWVYSKAGSSARGVIVVVSGDTSLHVEAGPTHASLVPQSIKLLPPYPNPFNPEVVIPFEISAPQVEVQIQIVNTLGQRVHAFPMERMSVGSHQLKWNGKTSSGRLAASGRYYVRLMTSEGIQVQPIVLQR